MPQPSRFSTLLRRYRREAGLSQEGLAERADLSRRTISDLERGAKSTPQPATLQLILEALDLPEAERQILVAAIPPRTRRADHIEQIPTITSLPADLTPLLGREHDEAAAVHLLKSRSLRLLTLVGPGGVGKTRLAFRIAQSVAGAYADGVKLVSLTAVAAPDQVPLLIARTLGIQDRSSGSTLEHLTDFLRELDVLLVLDNFEHVLAAAQSINHLLLACPGLTVMVTSREPLRLRAEQLYDVSPLPLPENPDEADVEKVLSYPSIALFVQRAQANRSQFSMSSGLIPEVIQICRYCDGLPLAIELVAAHIRHMPPADILDRLRSGDYAFFIHAVDVPPRQQTIFSTIGWSYDLLAEGEQQLFQSLAVFRGGADREAIEDVFGAAEADASTMLESLLSKSLVVQRRTTRGEERMEMLDTVREFGLRAAERAGTLDGWKGRHADRYLRVSEAINGVVRLHGPTAALPLIEADYDNMVAALDWLTQQQSPVEAAALAGSLAEFWIFWGQIEEGRARLDGLIERAEKQEAVLPGIAYTAAARLAWIQNDFDRARRLHLSALAEARRLGDARAEAMALNNLGTVAHVRTDYNHAAEMYEQAVARARESDSLMALASPLGNLGVVAMQLCEFERSAALLDEAVQLYRQIGDSLRLAMTLGNRGDLAYRQGKSREAVAWHEEALTMKREIGDGLSVATALGDLALARIDLDELSEADLLLRQALGIFSKAGQKDGVIEVVQALGRIAQKRGRPEVAARFYAGTEAQRAELGMQIHPADRERYERAVDELQSALPAPELGSAWEQGRRLTIEELVIEANEHDF